VYYQFKPRVEAAQDDMECDPSKREPARPVAAAEHIHPTDNRYQIDERNPNDVVLKRMLRLELDEVKSEPYRTCGHIQATDHDHRERAFVHSIQRDPVSQYRTGADSYCKKASLGRQLTFRMADLWTAENRLAR
jgi:hypothetical protein